MREQMAKFSPHQNGVTAAGKWGREWTENSRDLETAVKLNESGSFSYKIMLGRVDFVKRIFVSAREHLSFRKNSFILHGF